MKSSMKLNRRVPLLGRAGRPHPKWLFRRCNGGVTGPFDEGEEGIDDAGGIIQTEGRFSPDNLNAVFAPADSGDDHPVEKGDPARSGRQRVMSRMFRPPA